MNLDEPWVIDSGSQQFSRNPPSPFEGRKIQARVARTLARGQTVCADGEIRVGTGFGRFLSGQDDYGLAAPG